MSDLGKKRKYLNCRHMLAPPTPNWTKRLISLSPPPILCHLCRACCEGDVKKIMPPVYSGIVQTRHCPKCQECHQTGFCASGKLIFSSMWCHPSFELLQIYKVRKRICVAEFWRIVCWHILGCKVWSKAMQSVGGSTARDRSLWGNFSIFNLVGRLGQATSGDSQNCFRTHHLTILILKHLKILTWQVEVWQVGTCEYIGHHIVTEGLHGYEAARNIWRYTF